MQKNCLGTRNLVVSEAWSIRMTNSGENPPERDFYLNTENAEVHLLEPNMALKGKKPCLGVFLGGDEDICKERGWSPGSSDFA